MPGSDGREVEGEGGAGEVGEGAGEVVEFLGLGEDGGDGDGALDGVGEADGGDERAQEGGGEVRGLEEGGEEGHIWGR